MDSRTISSWILVLSTVCCFSGFLHADEFQQLGVNLACGEFGKAPGIFNKDYTYPGARQFDYCREKGMNLVRIPFKWERVQSGLHEPLKAEELARLDQTIAQAHERNLVVLLDMHNYARFQGKLIGTEEVPNAAFADVWKQLATHFRDQDERLAYGIMNEPHGTKGLWKAAAQAAVDAIRSVDQKHIITVCGDGWSGAHSWQKYNKDLILNDPAGKLVYEAHQYFDKDNSGTYKRSYDSEGATPETGVKRLQPFIEWLEENQLRGFIGEFGVPDNDPRWLVVLDNALAEMQAHQVGGTYWAAGPWWNKYPLSIEPQNGQDRPQMAVLDFYLDTGNVQSKKPWLAAAEMADHAARKNQEDDARLGKRIYDFRDKAESYHFTNEGSEYSSELLEQAEEKSRGISFRHIGDPAWVGIGVYYGNLKCEQSDHFLLEARAEQPCSLELKVYSPDGKKFTARCQVTSEWQTFKLPFEEFKNGDLSLSTVKEIQKIEFQPSVSRQGNRLELRTLRMPVE